MMELIVVGRCLMKVEFMIYETVSVNFKLFE